MRMAIRSERGCGFRVKGGFYIEGRGVLVNCPALPLPITDCRTCGQPLIPFSRGIRKINPKEMIGEMAKERPNRLDIMFACRVRPHCDMAVCAPEMTKGWVMWVGSEYTMQSFMGEAERMGVSKRVAKFPKDLERGDVVYLAYKTAIERKEENRIVYDPAIFYVFHVTDKVQIVSEEEAKDATRIKAIEEKGITAVLERGSVGLESGSIAAKQEV